MINDSVVDTIGRTPVVRLNRLRVENGSEILVKLECRNPAGSVKDRTALSMVLEAERDGRLRPGGTIIESSSGNTGKALAMIGAARGYRVVLVTDPKAPKSMVDYVTALGAELEIITTPDEIGYQRPRLNRLKELMAVTPGAFWPCQYDNPANPKIHAEQTAYEILDDVPHFDALVAAVSTGGHICGLSETLKRKLPDVVTVGVDAKGSGAFGFPYHPWTMRGVGIVWKPENLRTELVDWVQLVTDHEGLATSRLLARKEGLLLGESAGATVFGALHHAHRNPGSRIVVVAPDDGCNYLGESYDDDWLRARDLYDRVTALSTVESLVAAAQEPASRPVTPDQVSGLVPTA